MNTETKTSHTPGPWHVGLRKPDSYRFIYGPRGEEIADCDLITLDRDECIANAGLIAAAPELLEALEDIYYHAYEADSPIDDIMADFDAMRNIARKAVAKAKGLES